LYLRCPYQAKVIKMLEAVSKRMVCIGSLSGYAQRCCFLPHYLSFPTFASQDSHLALLRILRPRAIGIKVGEQLGIAKSELTVPQSLVFFYLVNNKCACLLIQVIMMCMRCCMLEGIAKIVKNPIAVIILD